MSDTRLVNMATSLSSFAWLAWSVSNCLRWRGRAKTRLAKVARKQKKSVGTFILRELEAQKMRDSTFSRTYIPATADPDAKER